MSDHSSDLVRDLDRLRAGYRAAVAAAAGDPVRAELLAGEFDAAAVRMVAEHEGRPDLVQDVLDARTARSQNRGLDADLRARLASLGRGAA